MISTSPRFAQSGRIESFPINDWRTSPVPPPQASMPVDADVRPAVGEFARAVRDPLTIAVPAAAGPVTQGQELTVSGMPLAAGFWPGLFGLYGYYLPFVLLAAWVTLSLWDIVRREDLGGAGAIGWMAAVIAIPFVGSVAYLFAGGSPIPLAQRLMIVVGGSVLFVLVVGAGAVTGGVV